jgi:hypothetical protein
MINDQVFSEHVRGWLAGNPDDGEQACSRLRQLLKSQLRKIGQWNLPPKFLGYGGDSWESADAMNDLVQDAYLACILSRIEGLSQLLLGSDSIDGAVHQNIKWFLKDRQRAGNPIGSRVFSNVKAATESLVEAGRVGSSDRDRIRNSTDILVIGQTTPNAQSELVEFFSLELGNVEFTYASCRKCTGSWKLVETSIAAKLDLGLRGYKVGDLVAVLGGRATELLRAEGIDPEAMDDSPREFSELLTDFRTTTPDDRYYKFEALEDRFEQLLEIARSAITNSRIQARVIKMLNFLYDSIREGEDIRKLRQADIARKLDVSTSTLGEDIARLRSAGGIGMREASIEELKS